jgi:phenylpropionate dioxygenase-like ring-hydroxylating dioxygenase large terminal subunit
MSATAGASAPHPYPNAWYRACDSDDLAVGRSTSVELCGSTIALFRSDLTGEVAAIDGHCVHLGAALGGGCVEQGHLVCPFHGWTYGKDGRVVAIPYAKRRLHVGVRSYPVREIDGQVFVWHALHGPDLEPTYELDADPGIADGRLQHRGTYDGGEVAMTVFDFAENGPDLRHFATVHRALKVPWTSVDIPGFDACVEPKWYLDPAKRHVAWLEVWGTFAVLGRPIQAAAATARVEFIGPGSIARFHFERHGMGRVVLYHTHTPASERRVRTHLRWYADKTMPRWFAWYLVGNWISQWRDDVRIWERKRFRERPVLVREDGPILEMRRWFNQFYGDAP